MGAAVGKSESPKKGWLPESKLEAKMVEAMQRRAAAGTNMKSFNSIILKFPKIDESFMKCKDIFQQFDEDSNGVIDHEELKKCFQKLEISFTDEEINDLFEACDINEDMGMKFNEFIVLICLVYLLKDYPSAHQAVKETPKIYLACLRAEAGSPTREKDCFIFNTFLLIILAFMWSYCHVDVIFPNVYSRSRLHIASYIDALVASDEKSRMGMPNLEGTFETLVDAFVFLDKNKDGYVSRNEMVQAVNESGERSSGRIAMKRFEEMDWDKNGMVTFKEFLFAFTRWVGIEDNEDDEEGEEV